MHIVDHLLWASERDIEVIQNSKDIGDDVSVARDVDYCLLTDDEQKAHTVCSFINDNNYGVAHVEKGEGEYRVITVTHVPLAPNIIHSMSANMVSISHIFSLDFVGWGSCAQIPE